MTYPTTSSISQHFSPPIFCIQLLFERISSPWESNFEGIKTTFVRFLPSSSPSTSSSSIPLYPQRQIRVGSGHLFFIRGTTTQNDGPIWLDLEAKSGGDNQKIWKGRISLIKENEKILPIVCPLQQQQQNGLNLEAHFLLNISEIQKKNDNRQQNLKNKTIEKEAQTDYLNNGVIERGTQTNKELVPEATIQQTGAATTLQQIEHQKTITKQRQKDKKLIKLLLILLLKAKNENEKNFENRNLQKISKTTNTECSLPPYSDNLLNKLIKINKIKRGHFRAQIAYLSSVHRTIVEDKKVLNFERRGDEKKKINKNKLQTTINLKNIQKQPKIKKVEESPPSSGLQSIAFSSPNSSEEGNNERNLIIGRRLKVKENNEDLAIVRRKMKEELIKEEILNLNNYSTKIHKENQNSPPKSSTKSSPQIRQQKIPEENRRSNSKSSTKSSSTSSSTKSSKNQVIDAASILSSIKNSSSPTSSKSKSSTKSSKSSSTNTTTKNKISDEEGSTSTVTSKQTTESSTTKTTESSITTKKSSKRSSSISGGVGSSSVSTDSSVPVEIVGAQNSKSSSQTSGSIIDSDRTLKEESSPSNKEVLKNSKRQVLRDL
uniref:Uncharacterized protein n=1 Tax=Meloidogyne enterolobii TaxID=390850 RepID=A0A6V7V5G6_MELEN|nr:unnamed protein product [Meloidogyne enterolobii]